MAKRTKKLKKGIESLKNEIEEHFVKLEKDIKENKLEIGRYHTKELEKSLIKALEIKLQILNLKDSCLEKYKERLKRLKKLLEED